MPICRTITRKALGAAAACVLVSAAPGSEIVDRVVAIVGTEAVTLSEIDLELRLEALFSESEPGGMGNRGEEVLRRLIDRRLVMQDLSLTPFLQVQAADVDRQVEQLRDQRFLGGRDLEAALRHYRLTLEECRSFLKEQIAFERYVTFRFKTGLAASRQAIETFYQDEYLVLQRERGEPAAPLEEVSDLISRIVVERRATELLETRLLELRSLLRIESRLGPAKGEEP